MPANTPPGPGVDASGQSVLDPTANVIALQNAGEKRQDDLRKIERQLQHSEYKSNKDLIELYSRHDRDLRKMQADNDRRLRKAEAKRLDAIRAVDVQASGTDRSAGKWWQN